MKYLFDTNVWIAIQRGNQRIGIRWRQQDVDSVFLCTPALAELYQGALISAKRDENMKFVDDILLQHDCLAFGVPEAKRYAEIVKTMYAKNQSGKAIDLQIAATAAVHGLTVVTRNTRDFSSFPVQLHNPFTSPGTP